MTEITYAQDAHRRLKEAAGNCPAACYEDDYYRADAPWHWHGEMEISVVAEGSLEISVETESFTVEAGDAFFINAGRLHRIQELGEIPARSRSILFHPGFTGEADSLFHQQYIAPILENSHMKGMKLQKEIPWAQEVIRLAEGAWEKCLAEAPEGGECVRDNLSRAIFLLSSCREKGEGSATTRDLRDQDRIKRMLCYMAENFMDDISVSDLAEQADVSESECMRCFRNMIGSTPIQYLKTYRILRAADMLRNSDEKIVDVGITCGFQDMSYFTKTFRLAKGITPTEYRERYRRSEGKSV